MLVTVLGRVAMAFCLNCNNTGCILLGTSNARSNNEISIITGSGVSHNFSGHFFPRDWNGEVYYHFGFRPEGECVTDRVTVKAHVSQSKIDLNQVDTIIDVNASITLSAPNGFFNHSWSNGSTGSTLTITGQNLGTGIHIIWVNAMDSLNCLRGDTVL